MSDSPKIALFGGTFDPVHLGHLHMAALARDAMHLDEVRFLPCRISPHKTHTTPTAAENRLEMLRLATADFPWTVVDDFEIRRAGPSYTYQTAEAMAARFPDARLFWIMGGDQWLALPRWAESERLASLVEFIVFTRGESLPSYPNYRHHVIQGEHPASATAIRTAGGTGHPWLHPDVSKWIREHQLYQAGT